MVEGAASLHDVVHIPDCILHPMQMYRTVFEGRIVVGSIVLMVEEVGELVQRRPAHNWEIWAIEAVEALDHPIPCVEAAAIVVEGGQAFVEDNCRKSYCTDSSLCRWGGEDR